MKYFILSVFMVSTAQAFAFGQTCSEMARTTGSCFIEFNGVQRGRCEVCREGKSCFMALDGTERGLCEAYHEDKSCFMALDGNDRGWCQVLKEGKSCFMSDLDASERSRCENGDFPYSHFYWSH